MVSLLVRFYYRIYCDWVRKMFTPAILFGGMSVYVAADELKKKII